MSSFRPTALLGYLSRQLRTIPYLTTALTIIGLGVFLFLSHNYARHLASEAPDALNKSLLVSFDDNLRTRFPFDSFVQVWKMAAICLLPAGISGLLTQRGRKLVPVLTTIIIVLGSLWFAHDLRENWGPAHQTTLGEVPSPKAYYLKLGIIGATLLSMILLIFLYHNSTILDRYVARSFAVPFLLCMFGIIAIMITMDLLDHADDFVRGSFTMPMVLRFYLAQMPRFIVMIMDVVVLLSALYTLTRMSRFNEIISILGSGRSLFRILLPVFFIGGFCSVFSLALNYQWAPESERVVDNMLRYIDKTEERKRKEESTVYNIMYRNANERRTWFIGQITLDPANHGKMGDVTILEEDDKGRVFQIITALRGSWTPDRSEWRFTDVRVINPDKSLDLSEFEFESPDALAKATAAYSPTIYSRYYREDFLETPWSIMSDRVKPDYLSVQELASHVKSSTGQPSSSLPLYRTVLHSRFSLPFRCLLMALIAAPLGVISGRRGGLKSAATAVFIFVGIFFLSTILLKLGEGAQLPPWVAAWIVNAVGVLVGIFLLWLRNNNRPMPNLNPFKPRVLAR